MGNHLSRLWAALYFLWSSEKHWIILSCVVIIYVYVLSAFVDAFKAGCFCFPLQIPPQTLPWLPSLFLLHSPCIQCSFHAELLASPYMCQALSSPCFCSDFPQMESSFPLCSGELWLLLEDCSDVKPLTSLSIEWSCPLALGGLKAYLLAHLLSWIFFFFTVFLWVYKLGGKVLILSI